MAKDITIGGRDTGRTSGSGGNSGGCQDLVGKSATVDKGGNVSWHDGNVSWHDGNVSWHDGNVSLHGGEERKDGGGYPSSSNGYGGDHGGGSGGHGSYSGKHFDNGRPITRYGDKLVASAAAFKKANAEIAQAISVAQSVEPALQQLIHGEWSLGVHTTSLSGRKSKDTDGISNQAKGCFGYIKHNGSVSIDKLRLFTLRDSDLTEIDMVYFSNEMAPYSARFNYLDFSYNRINDSGISCLFNNAFIPTGTYAKHIVSLNLSNNNLGNDSAIIISNAIANGQLTATKSIDLSGNNITEVGDGYFVKALKSEAVNFIAITLESHAGRDAVVDFLKKGSSYYFKEFVKRFKNNIDTQYIKTDEDSAFMHCKEGVPKAVVGVTLGIAKCTNPIAKIINSLPQPGEKVPFVTKAVNKLGLFACVMSEEGDNIVTPDLVGCVAEIHEEVDSCVVM